MGSQREGHDRATFSFTFTFSSIRDSMIHLSMYLLMVLSMNLSSSISVILTQESLSPPETLAISGDILGCHTAGRWIATGI